MPAVEKKSIFITPKAQLGLTPSLFRQRLSKSALPRTIPLVVRIVYVLILILIEVFRIRRNLEPYPELKVGKKDDFQFGVRL